MIRHILKQLWNKRRSNTWIFLELILVTFFMWGVLDPVYVLLSNRAIDQGYDFQNVFLLTIGQYPPVHRQYTPELDADSARKADFIKVYERVRRYPGIESAVVTLDSQYPLSSSTSTWGLKVDSLDSSALMMSFYQDGDFFKVFRIRDVNTGLIPDHHEPETRAMYITRNIADKLYPSADATGKNVYPQYGNDTTAYKVVGVVPDFKFRSTEQPYPTSFMPRSFRIGRLPWSSQICFRIRDGLSPQVFAEQFKEELAPQLSLGNLYFLQLKDFNTIYARSEFEHGVTNKLRLQPGLAIFFLLCVFLGVAGTFWLRSDSRKGEIGLRMAMGCSRKRILKEFLTESWLLTTVAWLIGTLFVLQRVYYGGFAEPPQFQTDAYIQNRFLPHFLIVSLVVYLLLALITLIGTWIPARQAASTEPAEALRNE